MAERSIRDMTISTLLAEAQALQSDVVRLRRTIHRQPELGLQLPRTQAAILQALDGLGLHLRKGDRLTSVVATLKGARPGHPAARGHGCPSGP
jgi:metal-dependent amidase/aminoacylase/carboxypeptidase family protein